MGKKNKDISRWIDSMNFVRGIIALALLMCVNMSVYAGVPDWVRQIGTPVEIKDTVYDYYCPESIYIKGYLVNYDVSCRCVSTYLESYYYFSYPIRYHYYRNIDEFPDMKGVVSLIFQDDNSVYIRGLALLKETEITSESDRSNRYWIQGIFEQNEQKVVFENFNVLIYELSGTLKEPDSFTTKWGNMLLSNDEGLEVRRNRSTDKIQFRCEPWGDLEYISPERGGNAVKGYGLYQNCSIIDFDNEIRERCTIYLDSEITMQRPQFFPGNVQWHYVGSMPQVDGGVYLAKIGNVVYLNLGDQLLRGIIGDGQVVFKGGQATSINLPTPVSGVDLPNRISDTIHMLKSLESWTSEKEYEATEEDVIFDYDPAARRLSSRKGFLFETPLQMPTFYSNKIPYPEATSHFDRLVLNDVPDLYSGVECMADAVHYGNAYISEGKVICDRPTDITIYSAAGAKVTDTFGSEYDFSALPSGIYIIKAGDRTFKIRR